MGQKTQPTASKHWRKIGSYEVGFDPIRSTNDTQINRNESTHSEMGPVRQNPIQRTVRTSHVLMTVRSFSTQYNTEQFCLQTTITAQMLSIRGEGGNRKSQLHRTDDTHLKAVQHELYTLYIYNWDPVSCHDPPSHSCAT